jgi:Uma2 family endonuclease
MPKAFFEGSPDLAVEVVSPGDTDREVTDKVRDYLSHDTPLVWVIRPESQTLTVHRPDMTARTYVPGEALTSADAGFEVEGFALRVEDLFD